VWTGLRLALGSRSKSVVGFTPKRHGQRVHVRAGTSDFACFEKVFIEEEYAEEAAPRVIIDAGANIGMTTLYYAQRFPQARIVAIEPEESNFAMLKLNCGHLANVTLLQAALWGEAKELGLCDAGAEKWAFAVAEKSTGDSSNPGIRGITLPEILAMVAPAGIDILKLDIEGAELALFSANPQAWLPQVSRIVIELHDRFVDGCARTFYRAIANFDYRQEVRGENIFIGLGRVRQGVATSVGPRQEKATEVATP